MVSAVDQNHYKSITFWHLEMAHDQLMAKLIEMAQYPKDTDLCKTQ